MSTFAVDFVALGVPLKLVPRAAFRVLLLYAREATTDDEGRSYAQLPRPWIAERLDCTRATVDLSIRQLVLAGLLSKVSRARFVGAERSYTVYEVLPKGVPHRGATSE